MRSLLTALGLIFFISFASVVHGEVAPPADTREPVRLTLADCISLGLAQNPQLDMGKAQIDQARSRTLQAKAGKLPTVKFSASVVRSNQLMEFKTSDPTMFPSGPSVIDPNNPGVPYPGVIHVHQLGFPGFEISSTREGDIYGVKLESQYALYVGGRLKNGIKAAKLNEQAAHEDLRQKKNELVYNVTQAFYLVLLTQEMLKVVDEAYATTDAHYRQVKAFYNEGMVSNLDVLKVEAYLAAIRPKQIEAGNGVEMAKLLLKNHINIDLATPIEAVGELEYEPHELPLPDDLYAQAIKYRPEARTLELRRQMAEKLVEINKANAYPTVGLFANYAWDRGAEMPPNDKIWRDGYQAGVGMSVPLFDGRATEGKVAEARAQLRQVEMGQRVLELGVKTQVEQAVLTLRAAEKKIAAEAANVEAAQKSYDVAKARYSVGLATNLDVMDAHAQLSQAKAQRLAAIHDYNLAWAQLEAALGLPEMR